MKLFGGKTDGGHVEKPPEPPVLRPQPEQQPKPAPAPEERKPNAVLEFLKGGGLRRFRVPLMILCCVALVALAAVVVHSVFFRPPETNGEGLNTYPSPTLRPAVTDLPTIATPPPETMPPEETEPPEATPEPVVRKDNVYTFVLLVMDQVGANTDTILVGRMDTAAGTLDLVNVPRDTLVNVSWPYKKLNTVYAFEHNDPEKFIEHLSGVLGFKVDNYAVASLRALERVVDNMGGLYFNVPRNMDYDDPTQDLHIHIAAGYQWLTGENTVKVLRFREGNDGTGYANGDIGRIQTQQTVLKEVAAQFLKNGIPNLEKTIGIFQENVKTDLTTENLLFYAEQFLKMDKDNIRFHTAPGIAVGIRGVSYYQLEVEDWIGLLNDYLNPWSADITESNLDVLGALGAEGAISTTGEVIPLSSFYA